jgi:hypothetical protein
MVTERRALLEKGVDYRAAPCALLRDIGVTGKEWYDQPMTDSYPSHNEP